MQPIFNEILFTLGILASIATIISAITPFVTNLIHGGQIDPKIKEKQQKLTSIFIGIGLLTISTALALPNVILTANMDVNLFHHLATDDLGPVKTLVWSADSTKLASIDQDFGTLQVWDVLTGKSEVVYQPPDTNINSPTWSPDRKYIAVNIDNHINILQVENTFLRPIFVLNTPLLSEGNRVIAWSPDGVHIAAACSDKTIRIWNIRAGQISSPNKPIIYILHQGNKYNLAWSPNGQYLTTESNDYTIQILSIRNGDKGSQVIHESSLSQSSLPTNIVWAPNGSALATKNANGRVMIWSFNTGKELWDVNESSSNEGPVAWSPDGQIISSHSPSLLYFIHFPNNDYSKKPTLETYYYSNKYKVINDIQWSPNDLYMAIATENGIDVRYSPKTQLALLLPQTSNDSLLVFEGEAVGGLFLLGTFILYNRFSHKDKYFLINKRNKIFDTILFYIETSSFTIISIILFTILLFITRDISKTFIGNALIIFWFLGIWFSVILIVYLLIKNYMIKYLTKTGRRIHGYIKNGEEYMNEKKYILAIENYDRVIALSSGIREAYFARGKAYLELKEPQLAIQDFDHALTLLKNSETFFLRGEAYSSEKKYEQAIEDYNHAIELSANNSKYYYKRAAAYLWLKDIVKAREDLIRSNELDPLDIASTWLIVWTEMGKQPFDKDTAKYVAEHLEQIAKINPQDRIASLCRGVASGFRGNLKRGLKEVETAILLAPKDYDAYFWKGIMTLYFSQDEEKSKAAIEESLALNLPPILLTPLFWLGIDNPNVFTSLVKSIVTKYGL